MRSFKTVVFLVPGHEYHEIFPDGQVPVVSFVPQYVGPALASGLLVDSCHLSYEQIKWLAEHGMRRWPDLFVDVKEAIEFVRHGFPLSTCHFDGGSTNDPNVMLSFFEYAMGVEDISISLEGDGGLDN
jgi:hypothetical protein